MLSVCLFMWNVRLVAGISVSEFLKKFFFLIVSVRLVEEESVSV